MLQDMMRVGPRQSIASFRSHLSHVVRGHQPIYLEYPVDPRQRYGPNGNSHPELEQMLASGRSAYRDMIDRFRAFRQEFTAIPLHQPDDPESPFWLNGWVQALDPVSLYAIPALYGSRLYVEIGSGNSTKFVRRAVRDGISSARIVSIDPFPRAEIDDICDEVIRKPVEDVDLDVFDRLEENDVLMVDNSHRCFQNSDVTVVFLDILPRLKSGVLIYIDDIYLPHDYPEEWKNRYYSEQYLLAILLMADKRRRYEILLPARYCFVDQALREFTADFWAHTGLPQLKGNGNGFWLRVVGP